MKSFWKISIISLLCVSIFTSSVISLNHNNKNIVELNETPEYILNESSIVPFDAEGLIVGGVEAIRNEFPGIVNLIIGFAFTNGTVLGYLCGGNIINETWIMTAAHCIYPPPNMALFSVSVTAGDHRRNQDDGTEQVINGKRAIFHPGYDEAFLSNDIGLVELNSTFELNEYVSTLSIADPLYPAGGFTRTMIVGWGRTSNESPASSIALRKTNATIVPQLECIRSYSIVQGARIIDSMVCAGDDGIGACNGDSGGPLYCSVNNGPLFVCGISSFVVGGYCGDVRFPTVFTRVSQFYNWIRYYVPTIHTEGAIPLPETTTSPPGVSSTSASTSADPNTDNNMGSLIKGSNVMMVYFCIVTLFQSLILCR